MRIRKYYPTVVLSDIHRGSDYSRTVEVTNFLKNIIAALLASRLGVEPYRLGRR